MKRFLLALLALIFIFGCAFGEGTVESKKTKVEGELVTPTPEPTLEPTPTPEPTLIPADRKLFIKSSAEDRKRFEEGEEVTLTLVTEGFLDSDRIDKIHWYRSLDGKEWEEFKHNEMSYTFQVNAETLKYWWKAAIDYTATK